jgi:hypothetical protein
VTSQAFFGDCLAAAELHGHECGAESRILIGLGVKRILPQLEYVTMACPAILVRLAPAGFFMPHDYNQ